MGIKYKDNDPSKGILIDWKLVRKEYKKLGIPKEMYTPLSEPLESAKYHILLSERSTGKTTNILLLGMILYKLYGIQIQYIRSRENMIMNKQIQDLMTVINDPEYKYIEKLTNGKYNCCYYHARRWRFCRIDNDGDIVEQLNEHFMMCLSIDRSEEYKSSYNAPKGDFIIYDEFIGKYYSQNEFVYFLDLCKTIIRDRTASPIIFMCANTIDKHSVYFDELGIKKQISKMQIGESKLITTEKGTTMNIHLIDPIKRSKQKIASNSLFFGFNNPKLNAITGGDWALDSVPHIQKWTNETIIDRRHYVQMGSELVRLNLCRVDELGLIVTVVGATKFYDDSIIYTCDDIKDKNHRYGFGYSKMDKLIWTLYKRNKFYYATNEQGAIIQTYINRVQRRL